MGPCFGNVYACQSQGERGREREEREVDAQNNIELEGGCV